MNTKTHSGHIKLPWTRGFMLLFLHRKGSLHATGPTLCIVWCSILSCFEVSNNALCGVCSYSLMKHSVKYMAPVSNHAALLVLVMLFTLLVHMSGSPLFAFLHNPHVSHRCSTPSASRPLHSCPPLHRRCRCALGLNHKWWRCPHGLRRLWHHSLVQKRRHEAIIRHSCTPGIALGNDNSWRLLSAYLWNGS